MCLAKLGLFVLHVTNQDCVLLKTIPYCVAVQPRQDMGVNNAKLGNVFVV